MAGEGRTGDGTMRVERVYERCRLEEEIVASAYELLVPVRRWALGNDRRRKVRPGESLSGHDEATWWRGVG